MKKRIAFICVHNSCRSQIAEALGRHFASDVFESHSAGTETSKLLGDIPEPDIAISMGCNVGCPFVGRTFDDNWGLEDPTGKSDEEFKMVIKEIEQRILQLRKVI